MSTEEAETASDPLPLLASMFLALLSRHESSLEAPAHAVAVFNPAARILSVFRGAPPTLGPLFEAKPGPPPASRASIDALPRVLITEEEDDGGGGASGGCAICLEEFAADDEAREMPCRHRFHSGCIEKWLSVHETCPVCRFAMPPEEGATKVPGEGGEDRARGQRPIVVMLVINGRGVSVPSSGHGSTGPERSPGSGSEDDGGSADSSPAQDAASGW